MINEETVENWIKDLESRSLASQCEAVNAKNWMEEHKAMARSLAFMEAVLLLETGMRDMYRERVERQNLEYSPKWDKPSI